MTRRTTQRSKSPKAKSTRRASIPDRGHLSTEQRLPASARLDSLSVVETLRLINRQDATIAAKIAAAIPRIAPLVEDIVRAFQGGGRLIYFGAGTSGRLGVLDASECPPTFHCDPAMVVGIIAGGDAALRKSSEGAEDDPEGARHEFARLDVGPDDVVVGIAAGGTTPYVLGGLQLAHERGSTTALICCVKRSQALRALASAECRSGATGRTVRSGTGRPVPSALLTPSTGLSVTIDRDRPTSGTQHRHQRCQGTAENAHCAGAIDHLICLPVGPEVLTGSTRMKAGTATKLVLNMISTAAMVQLGKAWGNLMVDLRATNAKLRDRAARIIAGQCGLPRNQALALLGRAGGRVKLALVMHHCALSAEAAQRLLDTHDGRLRPIIGPPR